MKRIPTYLKMRVLGALEYAEGTTMKARYESVAAMTFKDEDGHAHRFTWRTIQTWWYWYRQHGMVDSPQRCDKGATRKVPPEELLEAIEKVLPSFRGAPGNLQAIYRACIEGGHLRRKQVAPGTFRRHVRQFELLKQVEGMVDGPAKKARLAFAKAQGLRMKRPNIYGKYICLRPNIFLDQFP